MITNTFILPCSMPINHYIDYNASDFSLRLIHFNFYTYYFMQKTALYLYNQFPFLIYFPWNIPLPNFIYINLQNQSVINCLSFIRLQSLIGGGGVRVSLKLKVTPQRKSVKTLAGIICIKECTFLVSQLLLTLLSLSISRRNILYWY